MVCQGYINLAFVRAVNTTKTCFSEIVSSVRSLAKYFQHSKGTFVSPRGHAMPSVYTFCSIFSIRELKQARRRRQQECHKFAYLTEKTKLLHALHVHFPFLDISQTFSFFLRREMTCFAVAWTTWTYDDKCSIMSSTDCALEFINFKEAHSIYCYSSFSHNRK